MHYEKEIVRSNVYDKRLYNLIAQVKIRGRSLQCEACGENAIMNKQYFREFDYEKFTQTPLCEV